jgi:hypothetical protein
MAERTPLMNVRTFLRGGYREIDEATDIISGQVRLFTVTPAGGTHRDVADSAPVIEQLHDFATCPMCPPFAEIEPRERLYGETLSKKVAVLRG